MISRNLTSNEDSRQRNRALDFLSAFYGADALFDSAAFHLQGKPWVLKRVRRRYVELCTEMLSEIRRAQGRSRRAA